MQATIEKYHGLVPVIWGEIFERCDDATLSKVGQVSKALRELSGRNLFWKRRLQARRLILFEKNYREACLAIAGNFVKHWSKRLNLKVEGNVFALEAELRTRTCGNIDAAFCKAVQDCRNPGLAIALNDAGSLDTLESRLKEALKAGQVRFPWFLRRAPRDPRALFRFNISKGAGMHGSLLLHLCDEVGAEELRVLVSSGGNCHNLWQQACKRLKDRAVMDEVLVEALEGRSEDIGELSWLIRDEKHQLPEKLLLRLMKAVARCYDSDLCRNAEGDHVFVEKRGREHPARFFGGILYGLNGIGMGQLELALQHLKPDDIRTKNVVLPLCDHVQRGWVRSDKWWQLFQFAANAGFEEPVLLRLLDLWGKNKSISAEELEGLIGKMWPYPEVLEAVLVRAERVHWGHVEQAISKHWPADAVLALFGATGEKRLLHICVPFAIKSGCSHHLVTRLAEEVEVVRLSTVKLALEKKRRSSMEALVEKCAEGELAGLKGALSKKGWQRFKRYFERQDWPLGSGILEAALNRRLQPEVVSFLVAQMKTIPKGLLKLAKKSDYPRAVLEDLRKKLPKKRKVAPRRRLAWS